MINTGLRTQRCLFKSVVRSPWSVVLFMLVLGPWSLIPGPSLASPSERLEAIKARLAQGPIVGNINIAGHYPYVETRIRKRITLRVGDLFDPENIEDQKERIIRFFDRLGFYNTQVRVS
ncbi:MAG: hypothetical protein HY609_06895, partial [Deltaproteobacteria bacterium]|nr:hypothetical protein [Deltaproteobacteria bacterium]